MTKEYYLSPALRTVFASMYLVDEKEKQARLKIISLVLLITAMLFSQFFIFRFNLAYGFDFDSVKVFFLFPLIQYRNGNHDSMMVTTSIIGYLCFFVFLIINYKKARARRTNLVTIAFILCFLAIFHEAKIFQQALTDSFTNRPIFVGWPLLIMCAVIFIDIFLTKNKPV